MTSIWRLPPLATILDPRPEVQAQRHPIRDAANIPFDQLCDRLAELPPRHMAILLAEFLDDPGREASIHAADFLDRGGRTFRWYPATPANEYTPGRLWAPNRLLEAAALATHGRRAVDLGCGAGRDSVALASAGFNAVGIDNLPEAISTASRLYDRWRGIGWGAFTGVCGDRSDAEGEYDLAISLFAFSPEVPEILNRLLPIGGVVAVEAFTTLDAEVSGKPVRDHHVPSAMLPGMFPNFQVLLFEEMWRDGRHIASFIGRKTE